MQGEAHDLAHEFPELRERIHALKTTDAHFRKLFDEYDAVVHEITRIEAEIETPEDAYVEEVKRKRLNLKDELYAMLRKAA